MTPPIAPETISQRLQRAWTERAWALKAASFAMVGVINAVVDFSIFSFAYYWLALPIVVANVMAWAVAVSGSYVMNSMTTFAAELGRKLRFNAYVAFALSQTAGLVGNTLTVLAASYVMPVLIGKVLALGVSFLINFSLSNFIVFRRSGH